MPLFCNLFASNWRHDFDNVFDTKGIFYEYCKNAQETFKNKRKTSFFTKLCKHKN